MKKFVLLVLAFVLMLSFAADAAMRVGCLTKSSTDPENFIGFLRTDGLWNSLPRHSQDDVIVFYDSLSSMLMALNSGAIDEIDLPDIVGAYLLNNRPDLKITCVVRMGHDNLAFGFLKGKGEALRDRFNDAIESLKSDGTMRKLAARYMNVDGKPESLEFENFDGAETITAAITGDLPPIDYVAADDRPSGFSTALLSEIAKRLNVNVRTVFVNTASRSAALASGRADVVFWYQVRENTDRQYDVPDTVILSDAYYDWNTFVHIGLKNAKPSK